MGRRITFELKDKANVPFSCIYKIWFGRKYYIGSTKRFLKRMQEHDYALNAELSKGNVKTGMYQHVIKHLLKNEGIEVAYVEILAVVENNKDLLLTEELFLFQSHASKSNLNVFKISISEAREIYQQKKRVKNAVLTYSS